MLGLEDYPPPPARAAHATRTNPPTPQTHSRCAPLTSSTAAFPGELTCSPWSGGRRARMHARTLARGPLGAALALRAGRRALKLSYGLTDCSGGEFDLGAERRALPQFVHGFGNLRVRPTVGQHHAPPNLPGFPGSLTPACPVEMVYMVFLYSVYL